MILSVYRQGRPAIRMDHPAALKAAAGSDDIDLLSYVFTHTTPVFVGVGGHPSIVKLEAEGDDSLTFEGLLDDAITARDYKRMQSHGVDSPQEIGFQRFRVHLACELVLRADFLLKARDDIDVGRRVKALVNDADFRARLTEALYEYCKSVLEDGDMSVRYGGALKIEDPADADAPPWEFLTHPDAD